MEKILITGAGGYIGTEMVNFFLKKGYHVVALDRFFFGNTLADLNGTKNLQIVKDDIRYLDKSHLKGVSTVIDLASISNDPSSELMPEITTNINLNGALHIATAAKKAGVKKFIFSSSCSIYGAGDGILTEKSRTAPISSYAKCKINAEKGLIKLADKNFCVTFLRNATVYGVSERRMRFDLIINIMTLHAWKNRKIYVMGQGNQWRPLVHISDLIKAFYIVAKEKHIDKINKEAFNVGSNEQNFKVFQIANRFRNFFNDLVIEQTPDDPDPRSYHVNFDKISQVLNYKTDKTIDDGILEVKNALENGIITDSVTTKTVDYYKYLINADKVLSDVKLKNKLF